MTLQFNRSLNSKKWTTVDGLPSDELLFNCDYCFQPKTNGIFKKMLPKVDGLVLNKNTCPSDILLSNDYRSCVGHRLAKLSPVCVKTFPLSSPTWSLFTLRIKSLNSDVFGIGFCDENNTYESNEFKNTVLWNFHEPFIRYYLNDGTMQMVGVNLNTRLKENDVLNIAIDSESNLLWLGVNYNWYPSKPGILNKHNLPYTSDQLTIQIPVFFITPSSNCFEIIKYEKFKPTHFSDAVSKPTYDWYLETYYQDSLMEEKTCL